MIPATAGWCRFRYRVPRVSGDDPLGCDQKLLAILCSPRERG